MFSDDRFLSCGTPRALYPCCPFDSVDTPRRALTTPDLDVGCLVDNVINSHTRVHVHPDDLCAALLESSLLALMETSVAVINHPELLYATAKYPVDPVWSDVWIAQIIHMTSIDYRRADVAVKWTYSSDELCKLQKKGLLSPSIGNIELSPWARVLSDHTDVICSSSIACVVDLPTKKVRNELYLKNWAIKWDKREDEYRRVSVRV